MADRDPSVDDHIGTVLHRVVRDMPHAPAIICGDRTMSYGELGDATNRLANLLVERGAGPEDLVAVHLERGPDLVVALLAVLQAGSAYIPLESTLPRARVRALLAESAPAIMVTQRRLAHHEAPQVICLDRDREAIDAQPATPPARVIEPENLAYLVHTSGTSGTPKGVLVEHRNLTHLCRAWRQRYRLDGLRLTFLTVASVSVDLFLADVMRSLLFGGTLVIYPTHQADPRELLDLVSRTRATGMELTPSLLGPLSEEIARRGVRFPPLRLLSVGSEPWQARDGRRLLDLLDTGTLAVNAYGQTETTIDATVFELTANSIAPDARLVPIGRPLPGVTVRVLDARLRAAPPGVAGELYVSGAGLARGYHGQPALTAERFVADPYGAPGGRMYRTGDLGRLLPTGDLEYTGRADGQLKVRGFRVEPAEVEAVLTEHLSVRSAAVRVLRSRLVADVEPRSGAQVDPVELRRFVAARLPAHMVPSRLHIVDGPPGTGDRDERLERDIAEVGAEVLEVPNVGPHDNVFSLGGDSILARSLTAEPRSAIRPARAGAPVPLSFSQQLLWFLSERCPDSPRFGTAIGLRLRGPVDLASLGRAVNGLVTRHEALRTTFPTVAGEPTQRVGAPFEVPLPVVAATRDELAEVLRAQLHQPYDLVRGPLVFATLIRLRPDEHVFVLRMHHLVTDGWSMGVLMRELGVLYSGDDDLDPLAVRYADVTQWQRERMAGRLLERQLAYWRDQLSDLRPMELPTDRPRCGRRGGASAFHRHSLPPDLVAGAEELAGAHDCTLFMAIVAVAQLVFSRYSGEDDVAVGTVTSGRDREELAGLVGLFVNLLVLRSRIEPGMSFRQFLAGTRRTVLDAIAHQDLPFERMVRELCPDREPNRTPLVQVVVSMQNTPGAPPQLPGLSVNPIEFPGTASAFELGLNCIPEPGGGLRVEIGYDTGLYDAATAARIGRHFRALLENAVADPDRPLAGLSTHSGREPCGTGAEGIHVLDGQRRPVPAGCRGQLHLIGPAGDLSPTGLLVHRRADGSLVLHGSRTGRGAVDQPSTEGAAPHQDARPPHTPTELVIHGIWTDLLPDPPSTADQKFFDAGGTSLDLVRLRDRIEAAFGRTVSIAALFEHCTVAAMARLVDGAGTPAHPQDADDHRL